MSLPDHVAAEKHDARALSPMRPRSPWLDVPGHVQRAPTGCNVIELGIFIKLAYAGKL